MTALLTPSPISRPDGAASPRPRRSLFPSTRQHRGRRTLSMTKRADPAMATPEASLQPQPWAGLPGGGQGVPCSPRCIFQKPRTIPMNPDSRRRPRRGAQPAPAAMGRPPRCIFEKSRTNPTDPDNHGAPKARCAATWLQRREQPPKCILEKIANQPSGSGQLRRTRSVVGGQTPGPARGARRTALSKNREPTLQIRTTAADPRRGPKPRISGGARHSPRRIFDKPRIIPMDPDNRRRPRLGVQPRVGRDVGRSPRCSFNKSRTNPMDRENRGVQGTVCNHVPAATLAARLSAFAKNHAGVGCGPTAGEPVPSHLRALLGGPYPRRTGPPRLARRPPWHLRHRTAPPQPVRPDTGPLLPARPRFLPLNPAPPSRYAPRVQPGPARAKTYPPRVQEGAPNHAVT
jgi:hypothetical protein